jgi:hypothetical protein
MEAGETQNGKLPLIMIHGAWLSARTWTNYPDYFGTRALAVSAPEWPQDVAAAIDSWLDGVLDSPVAAT